MSDTARLERRLARERAARKQAEALLEQKSLELYQSNQELAGAVSALEASSSSLSAILDHSFAGTLVSDEHNRIIVINRAAKAMFRQDEASVIESSILDLFDDGERTRCEGAATSYIGTDDEKGLEVWHQSHGRRPDGSSFPLEFIVTNLDVGEGRHRVWIFRDLTQQRTAEAERQALEENLRQAQKLEALGTMAGGVAHEINTPIQYVGDNINYLRDGIGDVLSVLRAYQALAEMIDADSKAAKALAEIQRLESEADLDFLLDEMPEAISQAKEGLARVSKIVQAVKQFAHPGSRERQAFDVNQAIESTIEVAKGEWKYVAEMETDYGEDLPTLTGHLGEFNQIILNLIVNAAQAIEECGKSGGGLIKIRTSLDNHAIKVAVNDNGCGIPKPILERIFEPFFTTKDVGNGTGQGLALCHRIMTQGFKGRVDVQSDEGKGATFSLQFPIETGMPEERKLAAV